MDMLAGLAAPRDIRPAPDSGTTRLAEDLASYSDHRWELDSILAVGPDRTLNGQNCTVLRTDVIGFSAPLRTSEDRLVIRDAVFRITNSVFKDIVDARSEDRGDGMLTVVGPGVPTATVIDRLFNWMLPDLEKHNSSHDDFTRFQLRAAIDVGPVTGDSMGFSGDA